MWFVCVDVYVVCDCMAKSERESHQCVHRIVEYEGRNMKHAILKVQCARVHILIVMGHIYLRTYTYIRICKVLNVKKKI